MATRKPKTPAKKTSTLTFEQNERNTYYCCACGKKYTQQTNNFPYSQSPLYKGNNSYLPICNHCLNNLYDQYLDQTGTHYEALKRVCMHWDIYFSDKLVESCKSPSSAVTKIKQHIKNCNLSQNSGKTYDSYLIENSGIISNLSDVNSDVVDITEDTIKKWGLGYSEVEYKMLNDHYRILREQINTEDPIQEAYVKDACEQHILKYRYRDSDIDKYDKVSKLYQSTLSNANLKPKNISKEMTSNNPDECWGNFNKIVETMSPAEYFKDKKIFKDHDQMHEYYKRFIERPTENLINGTSVMDEEFVIRNEDDE